MSELPYGTLNNTSYIPAWASKYYPLLTKQLDRETSVDEEVTPIILPTYTNPIVGPEIDKLVRSKLCASVVNEPWYKQSLSARSICPLKKGNPVGLFPGTITRIGLVMREHIISMLEVQMNTKNGIIPLTVHAFTPSKRLFAVGDKILIAYKTTLGSQSSDLLGFYNPFSQPATGTVLGVGSKTVTITYMEPWIGPPVTSTATVKLTGTTLKKGDNVSFTLSNAIKFLPTDKIPPTITNVVKV
jgi:hypothetical protein